MNADEFSFISNTIPAQPGIYKYFNKKNELLYVGKAKNLRKRVSSYFVKNHENRKTRELVKRIHSIEFTIVDDEADAFLLENNLIKKHRPPFNINLKDDKTYPYIVIKNEPFPRVFFTRKKINDGSQYYGPYTSVGVARELLDFIKQNIHLRNCSLNLSENNIAKKKFKVCLEYHLGNCKGPCEGIQTSSDYNNDIGQLIHILKGNFTSVIQHYRKIMQEHASNLEFEQAGMYKDRIEQLQQYKAKSSVVNEKAGSLDVFSILQEGDIAYVNYLHVNNGYIVQTKTITLQKHLEEKAEEILSFAIRELRNTFESDSPEILVPFAINYPDKDLKITIPKAGDKKKLLDLSEKNVNYFKLELKKRKLLQLENKTSKDLRKILNKLKTDLHLAELPVHIECFDNSNFQGSFPVSAMVCFKDGFPSKNDYRKFNVKTVKGIDDFATMKEAVYRRYKKLSEEEGFFPQLIIIDGGKGQLKAASEAMKELGISDKSTMIGLAKNEEELFFLNDKESVKLPWDDEGLKLIRRIRDEVHRFGIGFHRNQRSKNTFTSELNKIAGIGPSTIQTLLKKFRSVGNIKNATVDSLAVEIGQAKAKIIATYFKK